ncbi:MAG: DUF402 domain-containing protein [Microbacteriaceae bacterium]|nr:DUF402 domain-containing protein [Microbacteriaceae bacterium]MCL2794881.1 DUF402 domain-containing protein [Microbacteriaceae bacterium]
MHRFARGEAVVLRSIRQFQERGEAVSFAVSGFVVQDDGELAVVATTPGSAMRGRAGRGSGPNGRLVLEKDWDGSFEELVWRGETVVRVHRFGEPWSVWRWHDGTDWVGAWYGNLELPWSRTSIGFDTQDWTLDVVGSGMPGTEDWRVGYKDEDELAFLVEAGELDEGFAARARDAGRRLTDLARGGGWPFGADWAGWAPDSEWGTTGLPDGWRDLAA